MTPASSEGFQVQIGEEFLVFWYSEFTVYVRARRSSWFSKLGCIVTFIQEFEHGECHNDIKPVIFPIC